MRVWERRFAALVAVAVASVPSSVRAQTNSDPAPAFGAPSPASLPPPPLTLGELLDMSVSVGSQRDERISNAPASITAWADEDIKALGAHTIFDLANVTAGYSGTVTYGERILETRGQKAGSFNNNKHLIYFDGIPINHARNYKGPIDEELPLTSARRVEFLRGPASALYGTAAFFGAVNVVPKELLGEGAQVDARFSLGSRDGEWRASSTALLADQDHSLRIGFGYYDKSASRAPVGIIDDLNNRYWDDQKSIFLNASYGLKTTALAGTSLGFLYLRRQGGLGESWNENGSSHEINDLTWETIIPYLKYSRELGRSVQLRGYLLSNTGREAGVFAPLTADQIKTYEGVGNVLEVYQVQVDAVLGKAELEWTLGPATDLIAGITLDTRRERGSDRSHDYMVFADPGPPYQMGPTFATPSPRHTIYSAYFQLQQQLPILRGLTLTLGAREDHGRSSVQTFSELSPRLGLVQRLTEALNLKVFFGTALRAPGIKEIGLNQEARLDLAATGRSADRSFDLRAETIRSLEVGPSYVGRNFSVSMSLFSNRTIDALDGVQYQALNIFENSEGEIDAKGIETEIQLAPTRRLRFLANHSWARTRDAQEHDVEDVPIWHATFATIYQMAALPVTLAASARWVRGYRVSAGKDSRDNSVMADVNAIWSLSQDFHLELQARNLLDDTTKLPKHGLPDVPQPRFRVITSLACRF
jgi:outer membrane receptor for ferrienterochelin and colicins